MHASVSLKRYALLCLYRYSLLNGSFELKWTAHYSLVQCPYMSMHVPECIHMIHYMTSVVWMMALVCGKLICDDHMYH